MGRLIAILWDFDGTLVDSRLKNYNVARSLIATVTGKKADEFDVFSSMERYTQAATQAANWRDLYRREFNMTEEQIDEGGKMWTSFQLRDTTETILFAGIKETLESLNHVPRGIVSQNGRENILQILRRVQLAGHFKAIVGYEEVDIRKQKPEPDGLLHCLELLTGFVSGTVIYVGDHETDFQCAAKANEELNRRNLPLSIVSIGAAYGHVDGDSDWSLQPHFVAKQPQEIASIVKRLAG